jgi:hypothetical protein
MENNILRISLLSLVTLAGLSSLTPGRGAVAAIRTGLVGPDSPVTEVYYYYHGHRYPYYWNQRYYNHRRWQHDRWYYY